jgi:hypothetical protein
MENPFDSLIEVKNQRQAMRLKCLEIAALMTGSQQAKEGETTQQFLNRFVNLSNVIELNVTGQLPVSVPLAGS